MNTAAETHAAVESLLAFWAEAGVDACFEDAPVDRAAAPPPPAIKAAARAVASVVPAPDPAAAADAMAEARRLAAAASDLEALKAAADAFDGCPLKGLGARQAVFGRGNPAADLLVIGEAPGADEDARGEPFVGKAGQLLDRILDAAGLAGRVYIVNTVFWRPPGNRPPSPDEQAVCLPFVERALQLIQPRATLLLGASAARAVLGAGDGILKLRGQWREWRPAEGGLIVPVMPTLHPAFLLRQPQAKKQVWADILAMAARLDELGGQG